MALNRLLSLIASGGAEPQYGPLSRWTETSPLESGESEPDYGAFVDDDGRIITGNAPVRAFLDSNDPSSLELAPQLAQDLRNTTVVFLDWGRQTLDWPEIFRLWTEWEAEDRIADCGTVGLSWDQGGRWVSPGWIAFRGDFEGKPLETVVKKRASATSFLARARQLRSAETNTGIPADEAELPMLPFTKEDLLDPARSWPQDVA